MSTLSKEAKDVILGGAGFGAAAGAFGGIPLMTVEFWEGAFHIAEWSFYGGLAGAAIFGFNTAFPGKGRRD